MREIPEALRGIGDSDGRGGQWFEEDCDWAVVAVTWPRAVEAAGHYTNEPGTIVVDAFRTLRNWHPDEYEAWTGETVSAEESCVRADQILAAEQFHHVTDADERAKLLIIKAYCQFQFRHALCHVEGNHVLYLKLLSGYYAHAPH